MTALLPLLDRLRSVVFSVLRFRTLGSMVLAIDDENRVLLIRQAYGPPTWTIPGGGVQRGESFRQAALREACEEVGLVLDANSRVDLFGLYFKQRGGWQDHVALYTVHGWSLRASTSREITAIERFSVDDLPADTAESVRIRIDEWKGRKPRSDRW